MPNHLHINIFRVLAEEFPELLFNKAYISHTSNTPTSSIDDKLYRFESLGKSNTSLIQQIRDRASDPPCLVSREQEYAIVCLKRYWHALAIRTGILLYPDVLNLTKFDQLLHSIFGAANCKQVILNSQVNLALYNLLAAGEDKIIDWADKNSINYPFDKSTDDLFLSQMEDLYISHLSAIWRSPQGTCKERHAEYRQWLAFLSDRLEGEQVLAYEQCLEEMGWIGRPFLALRKTKHRQPFANLWRAYLKAMRQLTVFTDDELYWSDQGIPWKRRGNQHLYSLEPLIRQDGRIVWCYSNPR